MFKKIKRKSIYRTWVLLVILYVIGLFVTLITMVYSDIKHTKLSADRFKNYIIEKEKYDIKSEVQNRIDEIKYDLLRLEESQRVLIKEKILLTKDLLLSNPIFSQKESESNLDIIIREFERVVKHDTEHLYFMLGTDGTIYKSGIDDKAEGTNLLNSKDENNIYFIVEMLKSIDNPNGVYVTYNWPKVLNGKPLQKTAYCRYIPELNIILGTGFYYVDIIEMLQESVYSRLQYYYKDKEKYIFVNSIDGISIVNAQVDLIGTKVDNIIDNNGNSITKSMNEIVQNSGEGFISYPFMDLSTNLVSEKISYISSLGHEWNAYIGMGFHTNEIEYELDQYKKFFSKEHYNEFKLTILIFIILTIPMVLLTKHGVKLQLKYVKQKDIMFEDLFKLIPEGIIIISYFGEILYQNTLSKKILGSNVQNFITPFGLLKYEKTDNNELIVTNTKNRTYYIETRIEEITYKNRDSRLYFLRDITEDYLKSDNLRKLALFDELTDLPNRRQLLNDLEDICLESKDLKSLIIGMIDLDHFKQVNDRHGHDIGDSVLVTLAESFNLRLRSGDCIYRYGGEEFIIILRNIGLENSKKLLMHINSNFSTKTKERFNLNVTFSGGIVEVDTNNCKQEQFDEILKKSDELLYRAKERGRNRIEF